MRLNHIITAVLIFLTCWNSVLSGPYGVIMCFDEGDTLHIVGTEEAEHSCHTPGGEAGSGWADCFDVELEGVDFATSRDTYKLQPILTIVEPGNVSGRDGPLAALWKRERKLSRSPLECDGTSRQVSRTMVLRL